MSQRNKITEYFHDYVNRELKLRNVKISKSEKVQFVLNCPELDFN